MPSNTTNHLSYEEKVAILPKNLRNKDGKWQRKQLEVDFVVNEGSLRYYIQSALALPDEEKRKQETASLLKIILRRRQLSRRLQRDRAVDKC